MFYSKSTGGFYSREIHGDNIPNDAVEVSNEEHAALMQAQSEGKRIVFDADLDKPIAVDQPLPTIEELRAKMEVTAFQAKAALGRQSLYESVVALMNAPETPFEVKLAWQEALTFKRLSPTVVSMGAALGFTDEQLDGLFELAATIEA